MQMASLTVLLAAAKGGTQLTNTATTAGVGLLAVAAVLTFWSLASYMAALWPYLSGKRAP